jgi:thioredoxin reductase (NADPH)
MPEAVHAAALAAGRLRYCPVCDGFEVTDRDVAVLGAGARGAKEALFLRSFTSRVTLVDPAAVHSLAAQEREELAAAGVAIVDGPASHFALEPTGLGVSTPGGRRVFDVLYPALGSDAHSSLAGGLGAKLSTEGCIIVDSHQRTSTPGLYAAGDVVLGLDLISHAMGEAGVAATTMRNDLAALQPIYR